MIVTDADRLAVLTRYRRWRKSVRSSPYNTMRAIRDHLAEMAITTLYLGEEPDPRHVREWRAADDYLTSMRNRAAFWRRVHE